MPGPMRVKSEETASTFTGTSYGPVFGTIWRKNWFSASGSRENDTPGKKSGQTPRRKMPNQSCSSGAAATFIDCVLRAARPRRG
jgi:hypothetical protein